MKEAYKELVDKFSKLDIKTKHEEVENELQEILMIFHKLCKDKNIESKILTHEKMKNIENKNISQNEFLDVIYAYILSIKECIGNYLE